jgi:membrane-associated phospholipid phosphatase
MTAVATRREPTGTTTATRGRWLAAPPVTALLAAAGAAAVYAVFVRTALGQVVDEAAMRGAEVRHERVVAVLSHTLDGTSLLSISVVAVVAAAIGLLRRRVDLAVAAGVLVLGANLTTQVLKAQLVRPPLGDPAPNSLPSGHTTAAVSVAFALVLVLPYAARAALALAGAGYVTVIAVATVWAAWHRPSDTIAALLVTLGWGALAVTGVRLRRRGPVPPRTASRLATFPLTVGATVAGAIGLVGLGAVVLSERAVPGLVSGLAAFIAGSAGIAGATAAAFLVWVRLVAEGETGPRTG